MVTDKERREVARKLREADLIDKPTCKVLRNPLRCSNCGEQPWAGPDSVTSYCPYCGAEVVE